MSITITSKVTRNREKKWYTLEWGKGPDQRRAAGIFTYVTPKNIVQKNHNREALALLETKKSQLVLEKQSIGTPYIPTHQFKANFLDFYAGYVTKNKIKGNRRLECSLSQFRNFVKRDFISPKEITENLCIRFRKHLLKHLTGETPLNYFRAFKKVIRTAVKEGYFRINPAEEIKAKGNPSKFIKEFLEADEYLKLLETPLSNNEIREAFVVSCYTGLRWCDIQALKWENIENDNLTTRIIQHKTNEPLILSLHPLVKSIFKNKIEAFGNKKRTGHVFKLVTADGCNKALKRWMGYAGINKHITWHCARLSFSILLQDANVDIATVALMLGHTTSKYVHETYKRHRLKDQSEYLNKLPQAVW